MSPFNRCRRKPGWVAGSPRLRASSSKDNTRLKLRHQVAGSCRRRSCSARTRSLLCLIRIARSSRVTSRVATVNPRPAARSVAAQDGAAQDGTLQAPQGRPKSPDVPRRSRYPKPYEPDAGFEGRSDRRNRSRLTTGPREPPQRGSSVCRSSCARIRRRKSASSVHAMAAAITTFPGSPPYSSRSCVTSTAASIPRDSRTSATASM